MIISKKVEGCDENNPMKVGEIEIASNGIDATDPCYNKDVWCRQNGIKAMPGTYECYAWNAEDCGRVAGIMIRRKGKTDPACFDRGEFKVWKASIGVDAGLAGFFPHDAKPDYDDAAWIELCDELDCYNKNAYIRDGGFFASSGYGDGCYPVYSNASKDAFAIVFIG